MRERDQYGWIRFCLILAFGGVLILLGVGVLLAQDFGITHFSLDLQGRITLQHPADTNSYYILLRGAAVTNITLPVAMALGARRDPGSGEGFLTDPTAVGDDTFYRILQVPVKQPLDTDHDGIDDVYELRHGNFLNPLDPRDAQLDFNHNGKSNLQEYKDGTDPEAGAGLLLTTIISSSPAPGEQNVSVTRETILRFSDPLTSSVLLNTNQLFAEFGGRRLLSRIELAPDRRAVTLFYLEPLPGSARIRVTFNGDGVLDAHGLAVDADGDGVAGGTAIIDFDTVSRTPLANTIVVGRVFASELAIRTNGVTNISITVPLPGVIITADGLEETVRAVTDQFGNFRFTNAPAGEFFVHIDGRTIRDDTKGIHYPDLAYYPFVGKLWASLPGGETNIGNVYLPLISASTLEPVSPVTSTTISFPQSVLKDHPELEGVTVTVPPNALYSDDGKRGGEVGIAPVPPDRLPGPLPKGVQPALVITVQTDGPSNFDEPVPVCFPNLPDPITGQKLPPGAKSALWSFNHDVGEFQVVGPMTVSADGRLLCSDPGYGILAPGWHFGSPGSPAGGGGGGGGPGPNPPNGPGCNPATGECCGGGGGGPGNDSNPVNLFSGEKFEQVTDLTIPGVGMDFMWVRTYGSRNGPNTAQGNGWDFSYNIFIQANGETLDYGNGAYRRDTYVQRPLLAVQPHSLSGSGKSVGLKTSVTLGPGQHYQHVGFSKDVEVNQDGTLTMTMGDQRKLNFFGIDGSPLQGKIQTMVDRNGNTMTFHYDGQGRLASIIDTLGRTITLTYNSAGFLAAVTDFAGRSVKYEYYGANDSGGGPGDLKSVTSPAVTGTPNGNDFPGGKTVSYTYSKGFADENLNHNLLTITDGRRNDPNDPTFGQGPYLVNVYSSATDPNDPTYDRVVQQVRGADTICFTYVRLVNPVSGNSSVTPIPTSSSGTGGGSGSGASVVAPPQPPPASAGTASPGSAAMLKVIVNDRNGNVSEHLFDAGNRLMNLKEFTGRAKTGIPVTETSNRPQNKLRATDPDYFETIIEYNADSLPTRVVHPNGNSTERVYEVDLNPSAPARFRGNLRKVRRLPGAHSPAGDQPVLEGTFEYATDFACNGCGFNFETKHTDPNGNVTLREYDSQGNLLAITYPGGLSVERYTYNTRGQLIRRVLPDNGSQSQRVDDFVYYADGPARGYIQKVIIDSGHLALTTSYEYDAVGHVLRIVDARGHDTQHLVNALNQVVRATSREVRDGSGVRYRKDFAYDANNNLVRVDIQNVDDKGAVQSNTDFTTAYEYDILNRLIRTTQEVDPSHTIVTEYSYDGKGNLNLARFGEATAGRQPANTAQTIYDERDLLFEQILAPGAPEQSTTRYDYDANGNLIAAYGGLESGARLTQRQFDGYNRLVARTDSMGNTTSFTYDADGNWLHGVVQGELVNQAGSAKNVRLSETSHTYDALNRRVRTETASFDTASQQPVGVGKTVRQFTYNALSQVLSEVNDNGHAAQYGYDTANRRATVTDSRGNSLTYTYDANSNVLGLRSVAKNDAGGRDEQTVATYAYDNLNRVIRTADNLGNGSQFAYDSRGNLTRLIDARGNVTVSVYDGLRRLLEVDRQLTASGIGGGAPVHVIRTQQTWDDSNRLLTRTDDNGNVTRYTYDPLSRPIRQQLADNTVFSSIYDAHHNRIQLTDPNGTVATMAYDELGRLLQRTIAPGAGVSDSTTFEHFSYDGMSRMVAAENDASQVTIGYDSLGHALREALDGQQTVCTYDGAGNMLTCQYPGGRFVTQTYDTLERRKRISDQKGLIAAYSYVGVNRVVQRDFGNGTRLLHQYTLRNGPPDTPDSPDLTHDFRTTHSLIASGALIADQNNTWDAAYNVTAQQDLVGGEKQQYQYDSINRLIHSDQIVGAAPAEGVDYTLDGAGNRLSVTGGTDAGAYVLNNSTPQPNDAAVNQYTATPFDARDYDNNGNLLAINRGKPGQRGFQDHFRNRLVAFTDPSGVQTTYRYDALGRRIEKSIHSTVPETTRFFYKGQKEIEERDAAGATLATYVYGNYVDEVLTMRRGGSDFYYHGDNLLSVVAVTDAAGNVVERYRYQDFGFPKILDPSGAERTSSAIKNSFLFAGRRLDAESGLYFYRTRHLDSRAGRFTSRDNVGAWGDQNHGGNAFSYAGVNPRSRVDPYGLLPLGVAIVVGVEAAEGAGLIGGGAVLVGGATTVGGTTAVAGTVAGGVMAAGDTIVIGGAVGGAAAGGAAAGGTAGGGSLIGAGGALAGLAGLVGAGVVIGAGEAEGPDSTIPTQPDGDPIPPTDPDPTQPDQPPTQPNQPPTQPDQPPTHPDQPPTHPDQPPAPRPPNLPLPCPKPPVPQTPHIPDDPRGPEPDPFDEPTDPGWGPAGGPQPQPAPVPQPSPPPPAPPRHEQPSPGNEPSPFDEPTWPDLDTVPIGAGGGGGRRF